MTCCGCGYGGTAEQHFDARRAAKDTARYRKHGAEPTTRLLRSALAAQGRIEGSLLDVGCGIGALTIELLNLGISRATGVDASTAYLAAATEEAARSGRMSAVEFVHGDFLNVAARLSTATIVTLDRVICCYPAYEPMLKAALQLAERFLAVSYPKDEWYIRAAIGMENGIRRLKRNSFRAFVHPPAEMQRIVDGAGFRLVSRHGTFMWCADVYVRA
jgi:2-polyprenyl-3-methyl-5-hydroxy-6-metoxy-1,4-benzoquinol methylase